MSTNLCIYNQDNSQAIVLAGLLDDTGTPVVSAAITATLVRNGILLSGSDMTFAATDVAGSYQAILTGFDAPPGIAQMVVTGTNSGVSFTFTIFVNIAIRSL
jgi:hypothetical protein